MNVEIVASGLPDGPVRAEVTALAGDYEPAWYTTLNADQERPSWFFARREGTLVGFLTVFDPSGEAAEVAAFVDPRYRRGGIFHLLLAEARRSWDTPGRRWLLVADHHRAEGVAVASRLGRHSFTEATLGLLAEDRPGFPGLPSGLTLSEAEANDLNAVATVHGRANREDSSEYKEFLAHVFADPKRTLLVLKQGARAVGAGGLHRSDGLAEIFGLAVDPEFQGRGWGRALALGLLDLGATGTKEYRLEVDSSNTRAEALYRSLGFKDRDVTDYYEL